MPDPMAEAMPMDPAMGANPEPPSNLDENMVNEAMMAASQDFGSLDDVDDYEGMINAIRGDQAPMAERVNELAELVGLEDAQQTPESVVALIQPVMLLNSMDQGIGSIAEGVMDTEMSGDMTGGIMSTVNMEPPMDPAMAQPMPMDPGMDPGMGMPMEMGVGNEPPVNFRFGGPVARMQDGGDPVEESRLSQLFAEQQGVLNDNFGRAPVDPMDLEREREMNQAQMLFDVAGTALAFATPGSTQMSPAQRLAEAATETKLFDKIGARAQNQMDSEKAGKEARRTEKRDLDLLAFKGAQDQLDRELSQPGVSLFDFKTTPDGVISIDKATGATKLVYTNLADPNQRGFTTIGTDIYMTDAVEGTAVQVHAGDKNNDLRVMSEGQSLVNSKGEVIFQSDKDYVKVGDYLIDTDNLDPDGNPTVVFKVPVKPLVKIVDNQLVEYDQETRQAKAIFGNPSSSDIDPQMMVMTGPDGVKINFDATTARGAKLYEDAEKANETAGANLYTFGSVPVDKTTPAKVYNVNGTVVTSYDGGRTYLDSDGKYKSMPSPSDKANLIIPLSENSALAYTKHERQKVVAGEAYDAFIKADLEVSTEGLTDDEKVMSRSLEDDALNATGVAARFGSFVDNVFGGLGNTQFFAEDQTSKQKMKLFFQLNKTAFSSNPRNPITEQARILELFPNYEAVFVSPRTEADKLVSLKRVAQEEYKDGLEAVMEGLLTPEILKQTVDNNKDWLRLLRHLRLVNVDAGNTPVDSQAAENAALERLDNAFRQRRSN